MRMRNVWKLTVAVLLAALMVPLGMALRAPYTVVEVAKGRPLVPVVQEQLEQDEQVRDLALADSRVPAAIGAGRWEFIDTLGMSGYLPETLAACRAHVCRQGEFFNYSR